MPTLTIKEILAGDPTGLRLRVVAGRKGLDRTVAFPSIQKTGLALIRPEQYLYPDRLQVLGRTEVTYLRGLSAKRRAKREDEENNQRASVEIHSPVRLIKKCVGHNKETFGDYQHGEINQFSFAF